MKKVILEAKKLCKSFVSYGVTNNVLNDLDICIYEGDFTVIMGASGSGKSTLLYNLSGMDKPTSGEVFYKGELISEYKENKLAAFRRSEFGFVFQQIHLVSNLTLLENVLVPGYMDKTKSAKEVKDSAVRLLKIVNIEGAKDRLPSQVSGGEAQRGAIARAVINKPGLVFADEPTGALNKKNTKDVLNLLTMLNREGQSILMVTHDVKAALRADRIIYIEDGKAVGELELTKYDEETKKNRETQVNEWLASMQW